MEENNEIWKPVVGWEDQYMVSSLGRVKSLERVVKFGRATRVIKEKILTQYKPGTCEYFQVNLSKNGKQNWVVVHRLVATHFLPNPDNLPCINHKDEKKDNNMIWVNEDGSIDYDKSNLEWCTHSYNNSYNGLKLRQAQTLREGYKNNKYTMNHYKKPILQFSKDGYLVNKWDSAKDAERILGVDGPGIGHCCKGKVKTAGGYIWKYYDKETYLIGIMNNNIKKGAS